MRSQHGERFAGKGQVRTLALGCKVLGCDCEQYNEKDSSAAVNGAIIAPDLKKFAEWQIGMLEKGILQNQRLIHEIRQRYGIQE